MIDDWTLTNEWAVIDCPEYLFELHEYRHADGRQMMFIHLLVREWSKAMLKRLRHEFNVFRRCTDAPLYAVSTDDDEKWAHFVSLFGFKFLTQVICTDGAKRRLFFNLKDSTNGRVIQPAAGQLDQSEDRSVVRTDSVPDARVL